MMIHVWRKLHWDYIRNNPQSVSFTLVVYLFFTGFLFMTRWFAYRCTNSFLAQARACGQVLNFHCAFILVMILRKTITTLRVFGLGRYLPLDHYVYFHKLTGWSIAFFSLWHTFAHLGNFLLISKATTIPYLSLLFSPFLGIGWIAGMACISGWMLCLVLALMLVLSMNFIRRSGKFEVFYYSHKLYAIFFLCLFIHSPNSWKWLAFPMILFCVECISRSFKTKKDQHGLTYIVEGTLLPSRVIRLLIHKPIYFTFTPGDFVYVMVPWITRHEWHPITISSAPEDQYITIHIRAVGEWTNRLYDYFEHSQTVETEEFFQTRPLVPFSMMKFKSEGDSVNSQLDANTLSPESPTPQDCHKNDCQQKLRQTFQYHSAMITVNIEIDINQNNKNVNESNHKRANENQKQFLGNSCAVFQQPLKIHLDGPYGAPYSNIFQTEHAFLIATGIGVTPFASILQSIIYRQSGKKALEIQTRGMEKTPSPSKLKSLRKVDFVWINRDHSSFEWFVEKLASLNDQQVRIKDQQFLDIHMYVTGNETDLTQQSIAMLKRYGSSLNWQNGRPDWMKLFQQIRNQNRGKVTVFYCGRPDLGTTLRSLCNQFKFGFRKEVF